MSGARSDTRSGAPYALRAYPTDRARPDALGRWLLQTPAPEVIAHLSGTGHLMAARTGRRGPPGQFRNPELSFEVALRVQVIDGALAECLIAGERLQPVTADRVRSQKVESGWTAATWHQILQTLARTTAADRVAIPQRRLRTPARDAGDAWGAIAVLCEEQMPTVPRDDLLAVLATWPRPVRCTKDASGAEYRPAPNPTDHTVALVRIFMGTGTPEDVRVAQPAWSHMSMRSRAVFALPWQTPATRSVYIRFVYGAPDAERASTAGEYEGRARWSAVLSALALEDPDTPPAPEWQPFLDDLIRGHLLRLLPSGAYVSTPAFTAAITRLGVYLSTAQWTQILDAVTLDRHVQLGILFPLLAVGAARGQVTATHCEAWLSTKAHADDRTTAIRLLGAVRGVDERDEPAPEPPTPRTGRRRTP